MNGSLQDAYETDPKWARKEHRRGLALKAVTAGVLFTLALAVAAIVLGAKNSEQITKIQKTPCNAHPAGEACANVVERVARAEPIESSCIRFQRVTARRGRNCPHFFVNPHGHGASEAPGGDASQTGSTGHQQPSPEHGGGGSGHPGGHQQGHDPGSRSPQSAPEAESGGHEAGHPSGQSEGSATSSSPGSSEGAGHSEESSANPVAEGAGKAVEDVGGVVSEVGHTANEAVGKAVEGATGKTCGVAGVGC